MPCIRVLKSHITSWFFQMLSNSHLNMKGILGHSKRVASEGEQATEVCTTNSLRSENSIYALGTTLMAFLTLKLYHCRLIIAVLLFNIMPHTHWQKLAVNLSEINNHLSDSYLLQIYDDVTTAFFHYRLPWRRKVNDILQNICTTTAFDHIYYFILNYKNIIIDYKLNESNVNKVKTSSHAPPKHTVSKCDFPVVIDQFQVNTLCYVYKLWACPAGVCLSVFPEERLRSVLCNSVNQLVHIYRSCHLDSAVCRERIRGAA